eukprot:gb/GFBE01063895.1/.p1 GENE.gb/GFBE01063895.1/~~gb/GFBE01063895.1/.p1  ORF type:complete len:171 (+),score=54.20 gb/GFBE01063895.1/:1-513(+)
MAPVRGKRGNSSVEARAATKEDKLRVSNFELEKSKLALGSFAAHPVVPNIQNNIAQFQQATAQKGAIGEMLKRLPSDALDKILDSLKVHKDSHRIEVLSKQVFAQDTSNIIADKMAMTTAESTITSAVEHAFIQEYYDKTFDWKRYEAEVLEAIKHAARGDGARGAAALG